MVIKNNSKELRRRSQVAIKYKNASQDLPDFEKEGKEYHATYSKVTIESPENPYFKQL